MDSTITRIAKVKLLIIFLAFNTDNISARPQTSLEYQNMRPWYHSNPGDYFGQPKPEEFTNFGPTKRPGSINDRFPEVTTYRRPLKPRPGSSVHLGNRNKETTTHITLEYQPMRPSFHPNPGNAVGQIVPPGQPWPAKPEDYANFSQTQSPVNLVDRFKDKTTIRPKPGNTASQIVPQTTPTKKPVMVWTTKPNIELEDRLQADTTKKPSSASSQRNPSTPISLEYKPIKPSHQSSLSQISQIVPPGQPWPNIPQKFTTTTTGKPDTLWTTRPNVEDRFQEETTKQPRPTAATSLEYKPIKPSHQSSVSQISQIVPPGHPWPSNAADYQNFSQVVNSKPNLADRFQGVPDVAQISTTKKPGISLEYEENRPSFHPRPGEALGQIIPPGKPWPASVDEYHNFSQTTQRPVNLEDRVKEPAPTVSTENRPGFHPYPWGNVAQIVPPGKPWPSKVEDYQSFSQIVSTTARPSSVSQSTPNALRPSTSTTKPEILVSPDGTLFTSPTIGPTEKSRLAPSVSNLLSPESEAALALKAEQERKQMSKNSEPVVKSITTIDTTTTKREVGAKPEEKLFTTIYKEEKKEENEEEDKSEEKKVSTQSNEKNKDEEEEEEKCEFDGQSAEENFNFSDEAVEDGDFSNEEDGQFGEATPQVVVVRFPSFSPFHDSPYHYFNPHLIYHYPRFGF